MSPLIHINHGDGHRTSYRDLFAKLLDGIPSTGLIRGARFWRLVRASRVIFPTIDGDYASFIVVVAFPVEPLEGVGPKEMPHLPVQVHCAAQLAGCIEPTHGGSEREHGQTHELDLGNHAAQVGDLDFQKRRKMLKQSQAAVVEVCAKARGYIVEQGESYVASCPPNLRDAKIIETPAELLGGDLEDAD